MLSTPEHSPPYRELGLADDEYARIGQILGRAPNPTELAMYAVMWSEHCSYKSSKVHLRSFGQTTTEAMRQRLLAGIGANAGVVEVGDGWAVTFKIESHNHPSAVEPYQGAATGVGGIVRDILAMGARPIALADSLRVGPVDAADTARVLPAVVAGIGGYGNCIGIPTIGGELVFDRCYAGNPLVNALCVGVLRRSQLRTARASGTGNQIVLFGARTGRDGIGGVSVLASESFTASARAKAKLPSVQVGDPFTGKMLIECCAELVEAGLVLGIQDLGGAGLCCATSELASAGDGGMRVDLDAVPLRTPGMTPAEILCSESQERMCAVVRPGEVDAVLTICAKWELPATVIGAVTGDERLVVTWRGEEVVDLPPGSLAHQAPVYHRPVRRPPTQDALNAATPDALARPGTPHELRATLLRMVASPGLCSRAWVTDQYDRYVRGATVLAPPSDAGMVRIDETTQRGVALATDGNARYCALDPYLGAQLALAEAYRNVAVTGATPLAVTDCLNFGAPTDPGVMWQFAQAVRGLAEGCATLGIPVTGGNVSFYNQTGNTAILPTPVIGVLGVIEDVRRRIPTGVGSAGDALWLLGETRDEFGGSEWAHEMHGHLGGRPPAVHLGRERAIGAVLATASAEGLVSGAHDLSEGGLAQALVEACLYRDLGAAVRLPGPADPFVALFSESSARVLLGVPGAGAPALARLCTEHGVPVSRLGAVHTAPVLEITDVAAIPLAELRAAWERTLPSLFGPSLFGPSLFGSPAYANPPRPGR